MKECRWKCAKYLTPRILTITNPFLSRKHVLDISMAICDSKLTTAGFCERGRTIWSGHISWTTTALRWTARATTTVKLLEGWTFTIRDVTRHHSSASGMKSSERVKNILVCKCNGIRVRRFNSWNDIRACPCTSRPQLMELTPEAKRLPSFSWLFKRKDESSGPVFVLRSCFPEQWRKP